MKGLRTIFLVTIIILFYTLTAHSQSDVTLSIEPDIAIDEVLKKPVPVPSSSENAKKESEPRKKQTRSSVSTLKTKKAESVNKLKNIEIDDKNRKVIVNFTMKPVYNKFYLKSPVRLVIDVDNCILPEAKKKLRSTFFKELRAAQYRKHITRIVLEDENAEKFDIVVKGTRLELSAPEKKVVRKKEVIRTKKVKKAKYNRVRRLITVPLADKITFKIINDTAVDYRFGTFGFMDRFVLDIYNSRKALADEYIIDEPPIRNIQVTQPLKDKVRITFFVSNIVDYTVDSLNETIYITFQRPPESVKAITPSMKKEISVSVLTNKLQLLIDEKEKKLDIKKTILDENKKFYDELIQREKLYEQKAREAYDAGEYDSANIYASKAIKLQLEIDAAEKRYKKSLHDFENTRKYYEKLISDVLEQLKRVKLEKGVVEGQMDQEMRITKPSPVKPKVQEKNTKELALQKYQEAINYINQGEFYKALDALNESLKYDPTNRKVQDIRDRLREQLEF